MEGDINFGGFFGGIGGAVQNLFGASAAGAQASGYQAAAGGYQAASEFALKNAGYVMTATGIKLVKKTREIERVEGTEMAMAGHSGFTAGSGSSGDILRNSMMEGGLSKALIGTQGAIEAQSYRTQAAMYSAQQQQAMSSAAAAKSSQGGSMFGAGLSLLGALFAL